MLFDLFDCFSCDSTVKCNEINTVFCMHTDDIKEILCSQSCKISLIMNDTVVYRNCTDHSRTFRSQFATEWLCISMTGKIHDRFRTEFYCAHYFLHLNIIIFAVTGNSEIDIDLCAEHASDTFRVQCFMILVSTDCNLSFSDKLHQFVSFHMFFFSYCFDFRGENPLTSCIHLGCVVSHVVLPPFVYVNYIIFDVSKTRTAYTRKATVPCI